MPDQRPLDGRVGRPVTEREERPMTMTTQSMYEKASREAREWRENFEALQRALVGETGASGIETAHKLRKEAERACAALAEVFDLAGWHANDEADANDDSPDDAVAHVNGLIRQICRQALADLKTPNVALSRAARRGRGEPA